MPRLQKRAITAIGPIVRFSVITLGNTYNTSSSQFYRFPEVMKSNAAFSEIL